MKLAPLLLCCAFLSPLVAQVQPPAPPAAPAPPDPATLNLENFTVRGNAVIDFAISLRIYASDAPRKTRIIITEVVPHSDASRQDLRKGDEIIELNGRPVADMDPSIGPGTELGKLLLNHKLGDSLDLLVVTVRTESLKLRAGGAINLR